MTDKITLGKFIELLEAEEETNSVHFDILIDLIPKSLNSDRGSYDEVGLGYTLDEYSDDDYTHETVGELLKHCKESLGKTFTGYKGGDYPVTKDRLMNMSNYGYTGRMITGIESYSNMTTILTEKDDV